MPEKAAEVHRPGSPMRRRREAVMNTLAALLIELARFGLLTALILLASISAFAHGAPLDAHEIPTFVLERTELVQGAGNSSSETFANDASIRDANVRADRRSGPLRPESGGHR
jgi:hypothetical protein